MDIHRMTNEELRSELARVDADMRAAMDAGQDAKAVRLELATDICALLNP